MRAQVLSKSAGPRDPVGKHVNAMLLGDIVNESLVIMQFMAFQTYSVEISSHAPMQHRSSVSITEATVSEHYQPHQPSFDCSSPQRTSHSRYQPS